MAPFGPWPGTNPRVGSYTQNPGALFGWWEQREAIAKARLNDTPTASVTQIDTRDNWQYSRYTPLFTGAPTVDPNEDGVVYVMNGASSLIDSPVAGFNNLSKPAVSAFYAARWFSVQGPSTSSFTIPLELTNGANTINCNFQFTTGPGQLFLQMAGGAGGGTTNLNLGATAVVGQPLLPAKVPNTLAIWLDVLGGTLNVDLNDTLLASITPLNGGLDNMPRGPLQMRSSTGNSGMLMRVFGGYLAYSMGVV